MRPLALPLILAVAFAAGAKAQDAHDSLKYPDHPVRIIVPVAQGGACDTVGRMLAAKLSEQTNQAFFVENRTGAGTLIGTQIAAAAAPDGYTLVMGGLSNIVFNFALYHKLPYRPDDFVPVAILYSFPYVLVARNDLPQKDLKEIISYGRQSPGELTVAYPGSGSSQQILAAAFMRVTGTTLVEVPYRGAQAAYPDLMAGRVDLFFDSMTGALPYIAAHRVRGVALLAPRHYPALPDVPTMTEAGLPGLGVESWVGLFAPASTPPNILAELRHETRIAASDLRGEFEKSGGSLVEM
ncbi:MAG: tripartite tricarboxylate transporter substrate binding protein, partial [Bradyrhizobiaceae bacterium]|nr:tripartite tricarboxylate transporter substrate binding protein [Bradyrhizobiaceae bacterium]